MDYKRFIELVNCEMLILFDDDLIKASISKDEAIMHILIMDEEDYIALKPRLPKEVADIIDLIRDEVYPEWDNLKWGEVVIDDSFYSLLFSIKESNPDKYSKLEKLYEQIDDQIFSAGNTAFNSYGICYNMNDSYRDLLEATMTSTHRRKKVRIYGDYSTDTDKHFIESISQTPEKSSIICIIDNQLGQEERAHEILQKIKSISQVNPRIIFGTLFTSKKMDDYIEDSVYFLSTLKTEHSVLLSNILHSGYHYFLNKLHLEIKSNIDKAFREAKDNHLTANYLSNIAIKEGISDYQAIINWIRLMYETQTTDSDATFELVKMARIVEGLNSEKPSENIDDFVAKMNTYEIYDYSINKFYSTPMPGDIFVRHGEPNSYYIIIGQDCDKMVGNTRKERKDPLFEMLRAELVPMQGPQKYSLSDNKMRISHFGYNESKHIICVDYAHRYVCDQHILDLCSFNNNGDCVYIFDDDLQISSNGLIEGHRVEKHSESNAFFSALKILREKGLEELRTVLDCNNNVCSLLEFVEEKNRLHYPLQRICRLKDNYILYLSRLYLEYRGRQPFETINYSGVTDETIHFLYNGKSLPAKVRVNLVKYGTTTKNIALFDWHIAFDDLDSIATELLGYHIKKENDKDMIGLTSQPSIITLEKGKKMSIEKKKNNTAIVSLS